MTYDLPFILIISLGILVLILFAWILRLETKMRKLLVGSGANNLVDSLHNIDMELKEFAQFRNELELYLQHVESRLKRSVQGVHTLRYNPFRGTGEGGNQSFVTAFVNEEGDGVIISSLYSREHVSVFSKGVKKYKSDFELTKEEQEALESAKAQLKAS